MSLVGKLEELPLPDLLQVITTNQKSGKLSLTRHDAEGIIVFRQGKIIYAATTSARETLGHLLLTENLITEEQLLAALERQHRSAEEKRLGSILLEDAGLSLDDLTRVVQQQTGKVISEFLLWQSGFFKFDILNLADHGEIEVDAEDFLLERGLAADTVLLDFSAKLAALEERPEDVLLSSSSPHQSFQSLKSVMTEIRSPEFTGEVGLKILGYAQRLLPRSVLFFIRRGSFVGLSRGGTSSAAGNNVDVARIQVPCDAPSILASAADQKTTFRGALEPVEWNLYLISKLGGDTPTEAAALPLIVNEKVLLVLYGDNAGDGGRPLPRLDELELLVLQAGLAMEKKLLEKKIEQFEKLRAGG